MSKSYPNVTLEVRQLTTSEQIRFLKDGTIDVGFLVPPIEEETINTIPVREDPFVACVPRNHRLANTDEAVDIREFKHDKIIMTPKKSGEGYYNSIIELCRRGDFYPNISQTAQEQQTIVSLVASEIGIAFVPQRSERIFHENVRFIPLKQHHSKITALAWHEENNKPVIQLFVELIKSYVGSDK
jgi:DNA-binding transcriptional LysR family regulator